MFKFKIILVIVISSNIEEEEELCEILTKKYISRAFVHPQNEVINFTITKESCHYVNTFLIDLYSHRLRLACIMINS